MGMEIRGGDGGEEHEEVSRDGEGEVGVMASLESWRLMERQSCSGLRQSPSGDFGSCWVVCMMMKAPGWYAKLAKY